MSEGGSHKICQRISYPGNGDVRHIQVVLEVVLSAELAATRPELDVAIGAAPVAAPVGALRTDLVNLESSRVKIIPFFVSTGGI